MLPKDVAVPPVTRIFAEFAAGVRFEDLPKEVVRQAQLCVLDTLGTYAYAAVMSPRSTKVFLEYGLQLGGTPQASIWWFGQQVSCFTAAFVNGTIAHNIELDDGHILAHTHPGVAAIPAALAVAEARGLSGRDLITAIVLGYDLNIRLGDAITGPRAGAVYGRWFHSAIVGSYSAAVSVGKLLRLDAERFCDALGIANLGPVANLGIFHTGAMIKDAFGGWPSAVGVMAAELAEKGCTGDPIILEGPMHFCQAVSDDYDLERIIRGLGSEWNIMTIYRKRHAMCSQGHTTMDAGLKLCEKNPLNAEAIDKVEVRSYEYVYRMNERRPRSPQAAKWSIPYCLAVVLLRRRPISPDDFSDAALCDPEVLALAQRIEVMHDQEIEQYHQQHEDRRASEVTIVMKNGRKFSARVEHAKGFPENPLTEEEVRQKFRRLADSTYGASRIEEIVRAIDRLDQMSDVRTFVELLKK